MEAEKGEEEVESVTCGTCGQTVMRLGPFCYLCGRALDGQGDAGQTEGSADEIDFSNRLLCSDGACIGVIDERGVCKVCGKPYEPES
jgi:hypothetical protein